jgi:hypothetical protein
LDEPVSNFAFNFSFRHYVMAALTVLTGAHDVVAMLEQEPGLVECTTKARRCRSTP